MDEANVTALAQVDEDVEVISPQPKKQRQPTISWTDEVTDALLSYVYMTKPWGAKKITQAYDVVAASLDTHCDEFKNVTISGANVKSRVEKAVASYVGTYLSEGSNKSGFDGDKDSEDNYSNVMLWAKKIHEEMENMAKVKEEASLAGAADLSKQKSGLEESVLGIANRTSKSDKSTGERVKCNPNSSSSSSSHSAPVEEDGMSLYFKSVISAKSSEIALNERRFEEELRVRSKEEALAERRLALEEKKAQSDADNIALQIIKYNQSQMPK